MIDDREENPLVANVTVSSVDDTGAMELFTSDCAKKSSVSSELAGSVLKALVYLSWRGPATVFPTRLPFRMVVGAWIKMLPPAAPLIYGA